MTTGGLGAPGPRPTARSHELSVEADGSEHQPRKNGMRRPEPGGFIRTPGRSFRARMFWSGAKPAALCAYLLQLGLTQSR
ncbi:hypothetical protein AAFF_G00095080 [Aldrovandia affinis]|uniref:Uncharacterized protein n=1 Tax=Aldrovandia affinis TaxID=143900 RepID=A0AAD7WBP9_9TELE|nr:hypothetical protein AAFF_G00095080 [Aldrovandia affinis]